MNHNPQNINQEDGNFYKGLFFGLIFGIGLVWFLGTKEGKQLKEQLSSKGEEFVERGKESIDKVLSEGFVEDEQNIPPENDAK